MKLNNKAFTLIELLAVIVILAIIALIATPIVLSIIDDSKKSSTLRSAEFYLDGVEFSIAQSTLNNTTIKDGTYDILENGNICLGYEKDGVTCVSEVKVEVKGEVPKEGSKITIIDGQIDKVRLKYEEKEIVKDEKESLTYLEPEYEIGQEVTFNPGDGEKTWNVIDEDATTVTLMLTENLGNTVAWYKYSNYNTENTSNYGPKDAMDYLNSQTLEWDNVDPIESYSYINNLNGATEPTGYQKIEIKNGVTKLIHKDGDKATVEGISKARLLTLEEVFEIAQKTNQNLTEENLRVFIEENLEAANTLLQEQGMAVKLTSVEEAIAFTTQLDDFSWIQYETKYYQTYSVAWGMINIYGLNPNHDILLPEYLYQNLDSDSSTSLPFGYWTFSSHSRNFDGAWDVYHLGDTGFSNVDSESYSGVRPVITISKSKLLK